MFNRILLFGLSFIIVTLMACATKTIPLAPAVEKAPEGVPAPIAREGWEMEWERAQREARKDRRSVLYATMGSEMRIALIKAMKKYDIDMEVVIGRTSDLLERITRERRAGIYGVDLLSSGLATYTSVLREQGLLVPLEPLLILPEVKDPKLWHKGVLPFTNKEGTVLAFEAYVDQGIHINTDMVKPGDINSMQDLLNPRWKGKIISDDPTVPGRGQQWLSIATKRLGEDYIRKLALQDLLITRDMKQLIDWVAKGKYPISLGVRPDDFQEYKRAGAPVNNLPIKEVSYLLGGRGHIAQIANAPNPGASEVFLNWLLSREGQILWQEIRNSQSARLDVTIDHLIKAGLPIRQPDVDYFDTRSDYWELEVRPQYLKTIDEVFKPLVR